MVRPAYLKERLYSTIYPKCGAKMAEEKGRVTHCPTCGFRAHRDNVPLLWAKRRYWELIEKTKQPTFPPQLTFNLVNFLYS